MSLVQRFVLWVQGFFVGDGFYIYGWWYAPPYVLYGITGHLEHLWKRFRR